MAKTFSLHHSFKMKASVLLLCLLWIFSSADEYHKKSSNPPSLKVNEMEGSQDFWRQKAQNTLEAAFNRKINTNKAKNIIMFLGDGLGLTTIAAARMYMGSEQTQLSFEQFPHFGLSKTFCLDGQVADSACTATAYLSGVKAKYQTVGLNGQIDRNQCIVDPKHNTESIASWAQKACKATGVVSNTRITDASPAGAFAHITYRYWENNDFIEQECGKSDENIRDVSYQLVHGAVGKNMKVILGGGRKNFFNITETDDEGRPGARTDGRNLIEEWLEERKKIGKAEYVWHNQQLHEVDTDKTDYLLGLFESDHCMYNLDILNNNLQNQEPSLTDMTVAAIKMLQKEENGFFLFVEGGRIDNAQHDTKIHKVLEETKEFSRAIEYARKMTSELDTLIVVTSDHSHVFTYSGSANRGSDILGFAENSDMDGMPLMTLSYANGPGYWTAFNESQAERLNLTNVDFRNPEFTHPAGVPLYSDTHSGEDVGVYASGPFSHLFTGSYEQHFIPFLMARAAQIGAYKQGDETCGSSTNLKTTHLLLMGISLLLALMNKFNEQI